MTESLTQKCSVVGKGLNLVGKGLYHGVRFGLPALPLVFGVYSAFSGSADDSAGPAVVGTLGMYSISELFHALIMSA